MNGEDIQKVKELSRTVEELMPNKTVLAIHSEQLFHCLTDQTTAKPYVLPVNGATPQLVSFFYTNVKLDKWCPKTAEYELEKQKEGIGNTGIAEIIQRATPEQFYQWGRYVIDKDKSKQTRAYVGLYFPEKRVFDCFLHQTGTRNQADLAADILNDSITPTQQRLESNNWLHLTAPIAYAAGRIPGLRILDNMCREIQIQAEPILKAAEEAGIDYRRFNDLTV